MRLQSSSEHVWGIVLAAGEGSRLHDFIKNRYGEVCPKQYAAIIGGRSMLRHTLDRVEKIIPPKQLQIVVAKNHKQYLVNQITEKEQKSLLYTPLNKESAASIYLAISHIYFRDPNATIIIFPSDHFIGQEDHFLKYVDKAISFVEVHPDFAVMLGIVPRDANTQYGWIEMKHNFLLHEESRFYRVMSFKEKPTAQEAEKYLEKGYVWNSLVFAAKCEKLISLYRKHLKCIYKAFSKAKVIYGTEEEEKYIEEAFENIPSRNFSTCLLEQIPQSLFTLRVEGVYWSDWGTQEQVQETLETFRLK